MNRGNLLQDCEQREETSGARRSSEEEDTRGRLSRTFGRANCGFIGIRPKFPWHCGSSRILQTFHGRVCGAKDKGLNELSQGIRRGMGTRRPQIKDNCCRCATNPTGCENAGAGQLPPSLWHEYKVAVARSDYVPRRCLGILEQRKNHP